MKHDDLPQRWKAKVAEWVQKLGHSKNGRFSAMDFPCSHTVDVTLDDGSTASFLYAILIEAPELNEVGIFTEHCGYHIFFRLEARMWHGWRCRRLFVQLCGVLDALRRSHRTEDCADHFE